MTTIDIIDFIDFIFWLHTNLPKLVEHTPPTVFDVYTCFLLISARCNFYSIFMFEDKLWGHML